MSVFDELAALEERKQELLQKAKVDAVSRAEAAVAELNKLGFAYRLTAPKTEATRPTRKRGVRERVLQIVTDAPNGITRADIMAAMNATDKRSQQSVANALAALKRAGSVMGQKGIYKPVL